MVSTREIGLLRSAIEAQLAAVDAIESGLELADIAESLKAEVQEWRDCGIRLPRWLKQQAPNIASLLSIIQADNDLRMRLMQSADCPVSLGAWVKALKESDGEQERSVAEVRSA